MESKAADAAAAEKVAREFREVFNNIPEVIKLAKITRNS